MKRLLSLFAPALALLLCSSAHAGLVPVSNVDFGYDFGPDDNGKVFANTGKGYVQISNDRNNLGGNTGPSGTTHVTAATLTTNAGGVLGTQTFDSKTDPTLGVYSLVMTLTDLNPNDQKKFAAAALKKTFTFTGKFTGSFGEFAPSHGQSSGFSNIGSIFPVPVQEADIGSFHWKVVLNSYGYVGYPGSGKTGSLGADVTASQVKSTAITPEPSTMLLSCLGLSFLGAARWRKRRRAPLTLA